MPALTVVAGGPTTQRDDEQPVFFYDLGSPGCYLVAERIMAVLHPAPEWEPVHAAALGIALDPAGRSEIEAAAAGGELQPVRWPEPWPPDTELAMRAATWAKRGGRAVAFSLAAFRQAFAGGRDLGDEGTVLIAGAACEMHPTAMLKGITLKATARAMQAAHARARLAGVTALPAIAVGERVFCGPGCLEPAATALAATGRT
ncbi:MAG TPA: DsbA family protein [Solirubrobacteraceae bacterium]|nr:DsbA family protein [Solirubrobacteraceae bacterium]